MMNDQMEFINIYDKFNFTKIIIEESIGNIAMFKAMNDIFVSDNNYILIHQMNNTALIASIRFCNIFGSDSEDNHWKSFFNEKEINNQIRENVILKVFSTFEDWEYYHKNMISFRNEYVVHHQFCNANKKIRVPDFEIAFKLLKKYYYFILQKLYFVGEDQIVNNFDMMFKKVYDDTIDIYK